MTQPLFFEKVQKALGKSQAAKHRCLRPAPVEAGVFFIFEGTDKCSYAVAKEEEVQAGQDYLLVRTSTEMPLGFIAVDGCLINRGKRCDASICWSNEVALLDLKLNTENKWPGLGTVEGFHEQMKGTIGYLQDDLGIVMRDFSVRLYVVFPTATSTTNMQAELLRFESDIFNIFALDTTYTLIPDAPSEGLVPVLHL
jgi:hypothetical protein